MNGRAVCKLIGMGALVAVMLAAVGGCSQLPPLEEQALPELSEELVDQITQAMPTTAVVPPRPRKILLFDRCEGFRHGSIPVGDVAFKIMGQTTGAFETFLTDDMEIFEPSRLKQFDAIIFNNTTSLKFENPKHREALMQFVKSGKGIIGVHAATDNFYTWPEAAEMMGGLFAGHPWTADGTWAMKLNDPGHRLNRAFAGKGFRIRDEIYQFCDAGGPEKLRILVTLDMADEATRARGAPPASENDYPVSWLREFGKGRVFYCSLGHNNEIFWNKAVLQHYLDGIQYALGDLDADATPTAKLKEPPTPARAE